MPNSPAEHRRKLAQMRAGEVKKGKYRPPKDGHPKGTRKFARKDGAATPPRKT
jgi:hypothetical protein